MRIDYGLQAKVLVCNRQCVKAHRNVYVGGTAPAVSAGPVGSHTSLRKCASLSSKS